MPAPDIPDGHGQRAEWTAGGVTGTGFLEDQLCHGPWASCLLTFCCHSIAPVKSSVLRVSFSPAEPPRLWSMETSSFSRCLVDELWNHPPPSPLESTWVIGEYPIVGSRAMCPPLARAARLAWRALTANDRRDRGEGGGGPLRIHRMTLASGQGPVSFPLTREGGAYPATGHRPGHRPVMDEALTPGQTWGPKVRHSHHQICPAARRLSSQPIIPSPIPTHDSLQ